MVSFSCRISPRTSTVILRERSPLAMAVATSAMLRTWPVRLPAIELTLSVRSFQVPATPGTCGLAAELAFGADLARDARHLGGEGVELIDHRVDGVLELRGSRRLTSTVILRDRSPRATAVATSAMLRTWPVRLRGHRVDVVGEVLPGAGDAAHLRLAAELALGADLARDARHLAGEGVELIDHRVDGLLQLAGSRRCTSTVIFLRQVAARDRGRHLGDVAHLRRSGCWPSS